jgi:hypothetical protein
MTVKATQPPAGGDAPPVTARLSGGERLDLVALATEICRQYRLEFPDEQGRYGDAGNAWCIHDNQHLLSWAIEAANGHLDMSEQVSWLASVLAARGFPLPRLARDLDLAAVVMQGRVSGAPGALVAGQLRDAAALVRTDDDSLDQAS